MCAVAAPGEDAASGTRAPRALSTGCDFTGAYHTGPKVLKKKSRGRGVHFLSWSSGTIFPVRSISFASARTASKPSRSVPHDLPRSRCPRRSRGSVPSSRTRRAGGCSRSPPGSRRSFTPDASSLTMSCVLAICGRAVAVSPARAGFRLVHPLDRLVEQREQEVHVGPVGVVVLLAAEFCVGVHGLLGISGC